MLGCRKRFALYKSFNTFVLKILSGKQVKPAELTFICALSLSLPPPKSRSLSPLTGRLQKSGRAYRLFPVLHLMVNKTQPERDFL